MGRCTNKIVVMTRGTSGISPAAKAQFIKEGAEVVLIGRSPQSVGNAQERDWRQWRCNRCQYRGPRRIMDAAGERVN